MALRSTTYTLRCDWCGHTWEQPKMTEPHMCGACRSDDSHEVEEDANEPH